MDEMNNKIFFQPKNVAKMKRLLEGRGYATEVKFGEVRLSFKDCVTVITTNEFPFSSLSDLDVEAIKTRCAICSLTIAQ